VLGSVSALVGSGAVAGHALVLDVGDEAVVVVSVVGDDLQKNFHGQHTFRCWFLSHLSAAVGQGDPVLSGDDAILVLGLLLVEAGAGVAVLDAVGVGEGPGRDLAVRVAVRMRRAGGDGQSRGGDGGEEDELRDGKQSVFDKGKLELIMLFLFIALSGVISSIKMQSRRADERSQGQDELRMPPPPPSRLSSAFTATISHRRRYLQSEAKDEEKVASKSSTPKAEILPSMARDFPAFDFP